MELINETLNRIKKKTIFQTSDKEVFYNLELAKEHEKELEMQEKITKFVEFALEKNPELIKEELIALLTEYEEYDPNKKDINER